MQTQIAAALKAAKAYKPRNEGDRSTSELIVALLTDAETKAAIVEELADSWERSERVRVAQQELLEAQSA
jgi:hypothetical protein